MNLKSFSLILCMIGIIEVYSEISKEIFIIILIAFVFQFFNRIPLYISRAIKILIVSITTYYLWKKFNGLLVTEVGISIIVVMSILKLSELDSLDDYFNMFLILLLLEACIFISIPGLAIFVFGLVKISFYFYFLLKLQNHNLKLLNFKRVILLILPALIFAVILYFTFPRFTQGFIGLVNINSSQQKTGNSELNFSDFEKINLSDKVIFKALDLSANIENVSKLYWKVNHLWSFRKNQWRLGNHSLREKEGFHEKNGDKINYSIKIDQGFLDYIPHLEGKTIIENKNIDYVYYRDNIFRFKGGSKRGQTVLSLTLLDEKLDSTDIENNLALKLDHDKKEYYKQKILKNVMPKANRQVRISELIKFFSSKKYQYSLSPRKYKDVYDFIENGEEGYCSHFAFSFAYLLRSIEIPSRVVIGYYGGNYNRFDGSISIREKDSHAWVEYIDDNNHWVRIDPTELVIPERISLETDQFLSFYFNKNGGISSLFEKIWPYRVSDQFKDLFDYLEGKTFNLIFNYDQAEQKKILKNNSSVIFSLSIILFLISYYFITKKFSIQKQDAALVRYKKFLKKMKKIGFIKSEHETATEFKSRIFTKNDKELQSYIDNETNTYLSSVYENRNLVE